MTRSVQINSNWVWLILSIYGQYEPFVDVLHDFLGEDAQYYLDHPDIFNGMYYNLDYGKKHNKIITSVVRAYICSYDSMLMNEYYLEIEETEAHRGDGYLLFVAHLITQLKKMYEDIEDDRILIRVKDKDFATLIVL